MTRQEVLILKSANYLSHNLYFKMAFGYYKYIQTDLLWC